MVPPDVGDRAPAFHLPSAQGDELGLEVYPTECRALYLWFSQGLLCPFCRQNMAQVKRVYPQLREAGAELWQVTGSAVAQGRLYSTRFSLPFPYLCDEDFAVHEAYGIGAKSAPERLVQGLASLPGHVRGALAGEQPPLGPELPRLGDMARKHQAVFLIDPEGRVRYRHLVDPRSPLPANAVWLEQLQSL